MVPINTVPRSNATLRCWSNSSRALAWKGVEVQVLGLAAADHGGESVPNLVTLTARAWGKQEDDGGDSAIVGGEAQGRDQRPVGD